MLKIRRSRDRLIFNMGIPIPGKDGLYIETGPRLFIFQDHFTVDCPSTREVILKDMGKMNST